MSPRLPELLKDLFPGSPSVDGLGMRAAPDDAVWDYAAANGLAVVTRNDDYVHRSSQRGPPPKVIWVALGNCTAGQIESLIRWRAEEIRDFLSSPTQALLELR